MDELGRRWLEVLEQPSDMRPQLPYLVAAVEETKAQRVLELGVRAGVSTVAFLHALRVTSGELYSVDLDPAPDLGYQSGWVFVQGDDRDLEVIDVLGRDFDVVLIDTSHEYAHTLAELAIYSRLVRPEGIVLCHDTDLPMPEGWPVRRALDDFCGLTGWEWTNWAGGYGLGRLEVT